MSSKKRSGFKLPISPKTLLDSIGLAEKQSSEKITLLVLADVSLDASLLRYAKEAFHPQGSNVSIIVEPYFAEPVSFAPQSDLIVLLAAEAPATGRLLVQALREQIPAVVVTTDPLLTQQVARDNYNEIDVQSIVTVLDFSLTKDEQYEQLFRELGDWIVRKVGESKISLARSLAFVREPFVRDAIQATALQNGAIAAVFFLPGADMPLLTLNQAKLFLQIAAAYGAEIDNQRLKELAVLLASGFGLRAIARRLVGLVPMFGWAMRGAVGFSGTLAIGQAAKAYFEAGGDIAEIVAGLKPGKKTVGGKVSR